MSPRVRFADPAENEVYLYSASTPTSTSSTLSGSPGPFTPPSPLASLPIEAKATSPIFHEALRLSTKFICRCDLTVDPRISLSSLEYFSTIQDEDATSPPSFSIELWSRWLPYVIEITPSVGQSVTVSDVFYGLYEALHAQMSDDEYEHCIKRFPVTKDAINNAFKKRCDKLMEHNVGLAEQERKMGRRRIDMLGGRNMFYGLSEDPDTGHIKFSVREV